MGASCNLTGKNEQDTINNYAEWSTSWLKTVSYDLMLTIQKLKTICSGQRSCQNESVEYNALCELIGSLYIHLKEKYTDKELDTTDYGEKYSVLNNIYNNVVRMKDEINGEKPIEIETTSLFNLDKKKYHKIAIPGNALYYRGFANKFRVRKWFYEIDGYIHKYFGNVENPFETEFSLVFNDILTVERLNKSMLDNVLWSPKKYKNLKLLIIIQKKNQNALQKHQYLFQKILNSIIQKLNLNTMKV